MGIFDRFRKTGPEYAPAEFFDSWRFDSTTLDLIRNMSPADMWASQPYLRTVVTFMARNIAQLGLHTFRRVTETDRQRVRDGDLVGSLSRPNPSTTGYELIYALVADLALYDTAHWLLSEEPGRRIVRLPVPWVTPKGGDALAPDYYLVQSDSQGRQVRIPTDSILTFHGWSPGSLRHGSSPVSALREILAEQTQAAEYRRKVWERGGKVSGVLSRPAGHKWPDEARRQFREDWQAKWTGNGPNAGGTPILEDGMTYQRVDFTAHENQFVEGAKLALTTVAQVYHLNPTMIGDNDGANYSNVREFRKMLYGDSLGPVVAMIEDRLNTFLVPRLDTRAGVYVEFNIAEKLQGSFEEQSAAASTATGAPWMTRNEQRARFNLPALPDGDALVTPLNVLVGGQASPRDSGTQNERTALVAAKAAPPATHHARHAEIIGKFFRRQSQVIRSALGVKADEDWWDADRWNRELASDLYQLGFFTSVATASQALEEIGFTADDYDADRTLAWLTKVAERVAGDVNQATKAALDEALKSDDPAAAVAHVFDVAASSRSEQLAQTMVTMFAGFATVEAARQVGAPSKTWLTGPRARPSHARLNGQTVPIDEPFGNGAMWPGDGPNADEAAGCNCSVQINTA